MLKGLVQKTQWIPEINDELLALAKRAHKLSLMQRFGRCKISIVTLAEISVEGLACIVVRLE